MFFNQRVLTDWNQLPQYVVDAPSTNAFKNRLDKFWSDDMGIKSTDSPLIDTRVQISSRKQTYIWNAYIIQYRSLRVCV